MLKRPKKLKKGDKVAIVSLSWGGAGDAVIYDRYLTAKTRLETLFGLEVVAMPHALKGTEFVEKHPELRAQDWMNAFKDPTIKGIISAIGGNDTIRLMPYIDYEVITSHPKIFMGYSDTTINHMMMYKAGVQSYYGPCILMEFAENVAMHDYTVEMIKRSLFSKEAIGELRQAKTWTGEYLPWDIKENNSIERKMQAETRGLEVLQGSGKVQGHLLGGCLEVLDWLRGTPLWPTLSEWQGSILFLETSEDQPSPDMVLWMMRALRATGVLDVISGIYMAKPYQETHYEAYKQVMLKVISEEMGRKDLPIVYNGNFGHTSPMQILPYGSTMVMNLDEKTLSIID